MAIILRYFSEFGRFHGQFHTSGWLAVDLVVLVNWFDNIIQKETQMLPITVHSLTLLPVVTKPNLRQ